MFILGYFLQALASILDILFFFAKIIIIAQAVLSWVSPDPYNPIVRMIQQMSEPILFPIRKRVPFFGGIDWSPMIAIMVIIFLESFLVPTLQRLGASFI